MPGGGDGYQGAALTADELAGLDAPSGKRRRLYHDGGSSAGSAAGSDATRSNLSAVFQRYGPQRWKSFVPEVTGEGGNDKKLRACKTCRMIKMIQQWQLYGCENCGGNFPPGLTRREAEDMTTRSFEGMCSVVTGNRAESWVSRWLGLDAASLKQGAYAVRLKIDRREMGEGDEVADEEGDAEPDHNTFADAVSARPSMSPTPMHSTDRQPTTRPPSAVVCPSSLAGTVPSAAPSVSASVHLPSLPKSEMA
eukprot:TRINITY_DN49411_c0_g1_i1.p1 TRINITY_DN49411_c0_g1~~TRINITY_DN49411_c0_g1_i1.p1  ORF type:complete len:251 (+),score=35.30 TRINITY_DN49411_c0_g1_i1:67-819(+)